MRTTLIPSAVLLLLLAVDASAQTTQITGRVADPDNASVPGARVRLTSIETGITREAKTGPEGYYSFPLLARGRYQAEVSATGFQTARRSGFTLNDGQILRLDFQLTLGQITESVTVSGAASLLETETQALSAVVTNQKVLDMPLHGRNPLGLAALAPGVRAVGTFGQLTVSSYSGSSVSIAGGPPSSNNLMVDGTAAENFTSGGAQITLSVDATEEVRIITRNASAEYGRTGGGVINMISKSGTNEFHGSAFEFLRNKSLNANDFFSSAASRERSPFVYNQYGATLGGRIVRNKTFFFGNWERVTQRTLARTFRSVPTDLQRQGDFSQTFDSARRQLVIYDPLTTRTDPARPGARIRDPFPGNAIPSGRLSPVGSAVSDYYPEPNTAGVPITNANNFLGEASAALNKDVYGIKIDHYISPAQRIAVRYTYDNTFQGSPNFYQNIAEITNNDLEYPRKSGLVNYTNPLRPNLLVEMRAGINRYAPVRNARSYGFDLTTIRIPAALNRMVTLPLFPYFAVSDLTAIGGNTGDHTVQGNDSWTFGGSATWIKGTHTVKFGAEERMYQQNNTQNFGSISFSTSRGFTNGPDPNAAAVNGHGYASLLLGYASGGSIVRGSTVTYNQKNFSAFVQDDWKATPKITLNLGLRWEYEGGITDRFNAISNFDPGLLTSHRGQELRGGLVFPGTNGLSRGHRDASLRDFGPRAGISWQALSKTVVRAGYGIFHLPTTGMLVRLGQTGFSVATPYVASVDGGFTPSRTLSDPFPEGVLSPPGSSLGALTGLGTSVSGNLRSLKRGYSQQWNLNVQQQLPANWLIELGYMANRGVSLPADRTFDHLPAATRSLGSQLQDLVDNPLAGLMPAGVGLAQARVTRGTLLDGYPQFAGAVGLDSWADSNYHAATVRAERRFSRGLAVLLSYTFSKLIDNSLGNGSNSGFLAGGSNSVQNWDDLRSERSVSSNDLPQRLVISATYELPVARTGHNLYRWLAGGWQVNTIASLQSGNVIAVSANAPAYGGSRPNVVGDPTLDSPTVDRWLNKDAFTNIPAFTFGNAPRNLPRTRTDGLTNFDVSLFKNISLTERFRLQVRAEAFNISNTTTFGSPSSNINATDFGVIRALAANTGPRQVQLAMKLYF